MEVYLKLVFSSIKKVNKKEKKGASIDVDDAPYDVAIRDPPVFYEPPTTTWLVIESIYESGQGFLRAILGRFKGHLRAILGLKLVEFQRQY